MAGCSRSPDCNGVPLVIVESGLRAVAEANGAAPEVENEVNMPVHHLYCNEIVAFSSVVHDHTRGLDGLELKVDIDGCVRTELIEGNERRCSFERGRMVNGGSHLGKGCCDLAIKKHIHLYYKTIV